MRRRQNRAHGERGAVAVEFALVAPVLFGLLFGFLEVGLLVVGSTAGTNAAREGARVGIVRYIDADDTGSTAFAAIDSRIRDKLVNLVQPGSNVVVTVRCLDYDTPNAQKPCDEDVEVGRDLLEVELQCKPMVATGFVSPDSRTDTARMTIVGDPSTAGTAGGVGVLAVLTLECSPLSFPEDSVSSVSCEVTRSNSSHTVTVTYATADGSASSGSDYTGTSGMLTFAANGPLTQTFTIPVFGDTVFEADEDFSVSLAGPSNATVGSPVDATIVIANDDAADTTGPSVTSIVLQDTLSPLGKVDTIVVTYDEALGSCAGTNGWSVTPGSSGYTLASVTKGTSSVTLMLNEGSAFYTAATGFTVSYAQNASGVCDSAGNLAASFGPTTPTDGAVPYLLGVTSANGGGGTLNRPNTGDTVTLQFSEPMQASGAGTLVLTRANGNGKDTFLTVAPYIPSVNLGTVTNWFGGNNGATATFATTLSASASNVVVTLGSCSGTCSFSTGAASVSIPSFGWAPTFPKDIADNSAATPVAPPATAIPFPVSLF